jgi:hypothetical protein
MAWDTKADLVYVPQCLFLERIVTTSWVELRGLGAQTVDQHARVKLEVFMIMV